MDDAVIRLLPVLSLSATALLFFGVGVGATLSGAMALWAERSSRSEPHLQTAAMVGSSWGSINQGLAFVVTALGWALAAEALWSVLP
jgi:hypothetical protein